MLFGYANLPGRTRLMLAFGSIWIPWEFSSHFHNDSPWTHWIFTHLGKWIKQPEVRGWRRAHPRDNNFPCLQPGIPDCASGSKMVILDMLKRVCSLVIVNMHVAETCRKVLLSVHRRDYESREASQLVCITDSIFCEQNWIHLSMGFSISLAAYSNFHLSVCYPHGCCLMYGENCLSSYIIPFVIEPRCWGGTGRGVNLAWACGRIPCLKVVGQGLE